MKAKTIAVVIAESGPEAFGQQNYKAALAYLAAGGARETEAQPVHVADYVEGEELDLTLLGIEES